jgi:hypothetical protein
MKDITKTYHIEHDFGKTTITYPQNGIPISIKIDFSWRTIFLIGLLAVIFGDVIVSIIQATK